MAAPRMYLTWPCLAAVSWCGYRLAALPLNRTGPQLCALDAAVRLRGRTSKGTQPRGGKAQSNVPTVWDEAVSRHASVPFGGISAEEATGVAMESLYQEIVSVRFAFCAC